MQYHQSKMMGSGDFVGADEIMPSPTNHRSEVNPNLIDTDSTYPRTNNNDDDILLKYPYEIEEITSKAAVRNNMGQIYKRAGNMREAFDAHAEALELYNLCRRNTNEVLTADPTDQLLLLEEMQSPSPPLKGGTLKNGRVARRNPSAAAANKSSSPPVNLELNIALTLQYMAKFHSIQGLQDIAPSMIDAHEQTILMLQEEEELSIEYSSFTNSVDNASQGTNTTAGLSNTSTPVHFSSSSSSPQRSERSRSVDSSISRKSEQNNISDSSPTSVLDNSFIFSNNENNKHHTTSPSSSSAKLLQLYNLVKLSKHERMRVVVSSLNALAKLYFKEEQRQKQQHPDSEEDAIHYHEVALNILCQVTDPISETSIPALDDTQFHQNNHSTININPINNKSTQNANLDNNMLTTASTTSSLSFSTTLENCSIALSSIGRHFTIDLRMDTAYTYLQIGLLHQHRGANEEAVESLEQALEIRKELYEREDSNEVMETCQALGVAYEQCGEIDMAVKCYFIVSRGANAGHHPSDENGGELVVEEGGYFVEMAQLCNDKCHTLIQNNSLNESQYEQALQWNEEAIQSCRNGIESASRSLLDNYGITDERVKESVSNSTKFTTAQDNRLQTILRQQLLEAIESRCKLFLISNDKREEEIAISYHRELVELQESTYGPYHPDVAQTYLSLGDLYRNQGAFVMAKELFTKAHKIYHDFGLGPNDPGCLVARSKLHEVNEQLYLESNGRGGMEINRRLSPIVERKGQREDEEERRSPRHRNLSSRERDVWDGIDSDDDSEVMVETRGQMEQMEIGKNHNKTSSPCNAVSCNPMSKVDTPEQHMPGEEGNHNDCAPWNVMDCNRPQQHGNHTPQNTDDKGNRLWDVIACDKHDDLSAITNDYPTPPSSRSRRSLQKSRQKKMRGSINKNNRDSKEWNLGNLVSTAVGTAVGTIQEATELFLDGRGRHNSFESKNSSSTSSLEEELGVRLKNVDEDQDFNQPIETQAKFDDNSILAESKAIGGSDTMSVAQSEQDRTVGESTLHGLDLESLHNLNRSTSLAHSEQDRTVGESTLHGLDLESLQNMNRSTALSDFDASVAASTLMGLDLVSNADKSLQIVDAPGQHEYRAPDPDQSALFGKDLHSAAEFENEGLIQPVEENAASSDDMDDLLGKMNVVSSDMTEQEAKPFQEHLKVGEKHVSIKSSPKRKGGGRDSTNQKILTYRELLMERKLKLGTTHRKVVKTMLSLANLYNEDKDYRRAILMYRDVYDIQIEEYGDRKEDISRTCTKLGNLYRAQGEFDKAMRYYILSRDIVRDLYGEDDHRIASILNRMGLAELERGDFDIAMDYLMHALKIQKQHLGPNEHNPDVSQTLVNIGTVYYKERNSVNTIRSKRDSYKSFIESGMLGKIAFAHAERGEYIQAMHFYEEVLQLLFNRGEARSSAGIVMTLNCLGNLNMKSGRYIVAMDFHEKALRTLRKSPDSPDIDHADTKAYMGIVEYNCGRFQKALAIFEEVLPVQKRTYGPGHTRVAKTFYHIGVIHTILCNYEEARMHLNDALATQLSILQTDHPDTLHTLSGIGRINFELDDVDNALLKFDGVLSGQQRIFGKHHPDIIETLNRLGAAHERLGNKSDAVKCFERSFRLCKQLLGMEHPTIATILLRIGKIREKEKKYTKALEIYQDCLRIRKDCLGENHYGTAHVFSCLATLHAKMGKFNDAMTNIELARTIGEKHLGLNHPFLGDVDTAESGIHTQRCHFDEAQKSLSRALEKYRFAKLPENHSRIQRVLQSIEKVKHDEELCV